MREEYEITAGVAVPTRKFCQDILNKYPSQFTGKSKTNIQDKYRRMIRKLK